MKLLLLRRVAGLQKVAGVFSLNLLLTITCFPIGAATAEELFNEAGYRQKYYRRPTPEQAPAGRYLTTSQLQALLAADDPPGLIDVQAITLRPEAEEFGLSWLPNDTRLHIEGSTWLPNVGYGELDARIAHFFRSNLEKISGGDKNKALVFYCVVDCWMSWNAVRRADAWGYSNLYWYPDGTDGWADAGLPLVPGYPEPLAEDEEIADDPELPSASAPRAFFADAENLDLALVAAEAKASGKDVLLFFETGHCQFCLRMRRAVLTEPALTERLHRDFIALAIDMQSASDLIDENGLRRTESDYAAAHRVVATPTMVFVDGDFDLLHRHSGLIATAGEMHRLLDFVAGRTFEEQSWQSYRRP